MLYSGKLIVSKAEQLHSGSKLLASHLGTNSSHLGTIWELSERRAKPLLYRERGRKPSGREKGLETSVIQRKRCEMGQTSAAYGQKSPPKRLKNRRHNKGTISVPMGISERQKGPSEPSDYLGLRVSHSLSRRTRGLANIAI